MSGKVIQGSFVGGQLKWSSSVQPKIATSPFQAKTAGPPATAFGGAPTGPVAVQLHRGCGTAGLAP